VNEVILPGSLQSRHVFDSANKTVTGSGSIQRLGGPNFLPSGATDIRCIEDSRAIHPQGRALVILSASSISRLMASDKDVGQAGVFA
jgi:hypothetical protein